MYVNAVTNQYGFFGQDGRKFLQRMSWGWYPAATGSRAGLKFRAVRRENFLMACQVSAS